jgi:hypothetical protein
MPVDAEIAQKVRLKGDLHEPAIVCERLSLTPALSRWERWEREKRPPPLHSPHACPILVDVDVNLTIGPEHSIFPRMKKTNTKTNSSVGPDFEEAPGGFAHLIDEDADLEVQQAGLIILPKPRFPASRERISKTMRNLITAKSATGKPRVAEPKL